MESVQNEKETNENMIKMMGIKRSNEGKWKVMFYHCQLLWADKHLYLLLNKAGYTATPVACGWAGAVIEVTRSFGQEQ